MRYSILKKFAKKRPDVHGYSDRYGVLYVENISVRHLEG